MKNIIEFYYNLSPENIKQKNNNYYINNTSSNHSRLWNIFTI